MKKILFVVAALGALAVTNTATAQDPAPRPQVTTAFNNHLDTVDNAEAHVTVPFNVLNWRTGITAQVVVKKINGTVGGTLAFEGSLDGTEWSLIGSATTPSDASANYSFNTTVRWWYYRIRWTGTGTMSASFRSTFQQY